MGIFLGFVWLTTRTMHLHGAYVRGAKPNPIDRPPRIILPLAFRYTTEGLMNFAQFVVDKGEQLTSEQLSGAWYAWWAVQFRPDGGRFGFACPPARTMHPHGAYV